MSFFQGNIYSHALQMETQFYVSLPHDGRQYNGCANPKTVILLHGGTDNASGWARRSQADYFAEKYGIAIFMPEVQSSFYQDMKYGMKYYTYVSEELPELIDKMFKVSTKREDMMVAGLSMGGYGALRVAFGRPERFSFCGAFSAACDIRTFVEYRDKIQNKEDDTNFEDGLVAILGTDFAIPEDSDLYKLIGKVSGYEQKPKLYLACGTEDFIYPMNVDFATYCRTLPLDFTYEEWPGMHDWDFWNVAVEKALRLFLGDVPMPKQELPPDVLKK